MDWLIAIKSMRILISCVTVIFMIIIHGCYSYKYYEFNPRTIDIGRGQIEFTSGRIYYDSLTNEWKNLVGKEPNAEIAWDICAIYKVDDTNSKVYLIEADTLFIFPNTDSTPIVIPPSVGNFDKIRDWGHGIHCFGPIKFDEHQFRELTVTTKLTLKDFEDHGNMGTILIRLLAELKGGHGSYFMR